MRLVSTAVCWLLLFTGCVSLDAPPDLTRYFLMNGPDLVEGEGGFAAKVEAVELEPYLSTQRMVVRSGDNEIHFSDLNRWAGPLGANIESVLNGYLALSPIGTIADRPGSAARLFVHVSVYRFEGHLAGRATLAASWAVEDASGTVLVRRRSEHTVSGWDGVDYGQLARLLESTVSILADEIASAI